MDCINLKDKFGDRYRIAYEESYYAEYGPNAHVEDPWLMTISCQNGEIIPWGADKLAACTQTAGSVANRLKALPFTTVAQEGADGANVLFRLEHFDAVAQIMKPRRRKRLSEKQRLANAERLKKYRFSPARGATNDGHSRDAVPVSDSGSIQAVERDSGGDNRALLTP